MFKMNYIVVPWQNTMDATEFLMDYQDFCNQDFCNQFKVILNKYSFDLMLLTVEYLQKSLEEYTQKVNYLIYRGLD